MMRIKMLAEVDCKQAAIDAGIQVFISVDMDEYVFPNDNKWTLMDELGMYLSRFT